MLRSALVAVAAAVICACGSSIPVAAPVASASTVPSPPATPSASQKCPTAEQVGAALGMTLPKPTAAAGAPSTLPHGVTAVICNYHGSTFNVIVEILSNVDPSYIGQFSSKFPVAYKSVSGLGDQARTFYVTIGGGRDNEGVVATKGRRLVAITATATPATLAQVEALVGELL